MNRVASQTGLQCRHFSQGAFMPSQTLSPSRLQSFMPSASFSVRLAALLLFVLVATAPAPIQIHAQPQPQTEEQVTAKARALLGKMTLEEKVAQLSQLPGFPVPEFQQLLGLSRNRSSGSMEPASAA